MPTDDDDRPRRRRREEEDDDDRPRRSRDDDDDDDDRPRAKKKKKSGSGLTIWLVVGGVMLFMLCGGGLLVALLLPAVSKVRDAAGRQKDSNNLKQITLGALNYEASYGYFSDGPYANNMGKPNQNLSFRVNLLPFMEQENVYKQFILTDAWDSPSNRRLADISITQLSCSLDPVGTTTTRHRAFVGKGTMFEPGTKVKIADVLDGTSNTIYVITADDGVPYSKVDELPYSATSPLPSFGKKAYSGGTQVAMVDGSVRFLKSTVAEKTVRQLIERNDGMVVFDPDW